ncbi:hypothetical protein KAFR_0K01950 [Kazachstania africana CBS 2517]|uniref:Transmembrane 9 superfamily member n=1 Tax=Kazachstania africana (strain ATCC 22294 / BCRC 22015 / CBS 2517 / CECT 1963 / NBRC 1671 / NRRL Y-8276) TaxID=1071382 RepID=H2B1P9_KAZAF|nr:hypothetical protein KAFR_0K01950 [Kazachstania africana CBS 2517]CCF60549.1 hypothetical protein KAFR_0K01950 [Kazachstania africana CBS 2517]
MRLRPTTFIIFFLLIVTISTIIYGHIPIIQRHDANRLTPNIYRKGDDVELIVNKIESDLTKLPYGYYDLPFICPPTNQRKPLHMSLTEILRGDRKWQSDYSLTFGKDNDCAVLCARKTTPEGIQKAINLVKKDYIVQWSIDNDLPASTTFISTSENRKYYIPGFSLGFVDPDTETAYLNNHVMLVIRYHAIDDEHFTIVGLEVYPKSVSDYHCPGASRNYEQFELVANDDEEVTYIPFTYSVYWREEFDVEWKDRYSFFSNSGELSKEITDKFRWILLANSSGLALFISMIVSVIFLRISKKNKNENSAIESKKGSMDVIARKWLRNDRTIHFNFLIVLVSFGVHFAFTLLGSLAISCSLQKFDNIRNSVLTLVLLFFVLGGFMASFVGTCLIMQKNKTMYKGSLKRLHYSPLFAMCCGSLLPAVIMIITIFLNNIVWAHGSSRALPLKTILFLISIYFIVCIPLSLLGGSYASDICQKRTLRAFSSPAQQKLAVTNSNLARTIKSIFDDPFSGLLASIGGLFPFFIIYVELQHVYKFVWLEKASFYYLRWFLFANIIILCIVVVEIAIISAYIMMHSSRSSLENSWRWRSFQISSSCAWYMELYSLYYIFYVLNTTGFSSILLSVCSSALFNGLCGCALGSIGYLATCWFVGRVYKLGNFNRQ